MAQVPQEALVAIDARILDAGARITRLLASDVESFFVRLVRGRFLADDELADRLSDEQIATLKRLAEEEGRAAAVALTEKLSVEGFWRSARAPRAADAPITELAPVADTVADVELRGSALLMRAGLGTDEPVKWALPARFIGGDNLGTLVPTLWKALAQRAVALNSATTEKKVAARGVRARRWDDA